MPLKQLERCAGSLAGFGGGREMARFAAALAVLATCATAEGSEFVYHGSWKTTNRPLDGEMTCVVTPVAKHEWKGRFHGVWQGVQFDHTVDFSGPPSDLRGTATIDGAAYQWRARIDQERFRGNFGGDRYTGSFDLKRREIPTAAQ
jgi:hypothetical protein